MPRIAGVDLSAGKRIDIGLTYIYGIGRSNVCQLLSQAQVDAAKRAKDLTENEINRIQKAIEKSFVVEGELHRSVADNIKRLRDIGTYKGTRHAKKLPARGQRTRSNARTKRGRRVTIGALKKEERMKMDQTKGKEVPEKTK